MRAVDAAIVAAMKIPPAALIAGAVVLALHDKSVWIWGTFLFVGCICNSQIEISRKRSG